MRLRTLYSRREDGKIQIWEKEIEEGKHRTHSGIKGGEIVTSEWTVCEPKNTGRKNATTPEDQAVAEAEAEWKKKKAKGYRENIDEIDEKAYFEPMLAKVWQDHKKDVIYPVFVQPKLDGLRLIAKRDGLWTRNGKSYHSIPHIAEALAPFFKDVPERIFDGECYADKFASDFDSICSLARKTKPTQDDLVESAKHIQYHIYDFPGMRVNFGDRLMMLYDILGPSIHPILKLVDTFEAHCEADVVQHFEAFISRGYEGAIVRSDGPYENKRSKHLLKYKEFTDEDYKIVDVVEGVGNKSGGAGSVTCQLTPTTTFNANIKGNREFCKKMLAEKHNYIGQVATIKYFNLTPGGVPRFPYFMRLHPGA